MGSGAGMAGDSAAPDYADPASWIRRPPPDAVQGGMADVFYVHPTTHPGPGFNQALDDPLSEAGLAVMTRQAAAFGPGCRVFAPRYRQASYRGFREPGPDADRAYERAYVDVLAAFRHYLRHDRGDRPLVLAGHSQGALHGARLLREVVEADGLERTLVAAYLVGIGVSEGLFGTLFRRVPPCGRPDQVGCVVSWNSFLQAPDSDPAPFLARTAARDRATLGGRAPGALICINPISFDKALPAVAAAGNPGSLADGPASVPRPGLAGAEDRDGLAWVTPASEAVLAAFPPLAGGNMHMHDIDLFHASLGADVARRVRAHAGTHAETRAKADR